jgi:glycosyltransferase involved in cell wall biosynthesis
MLSVILPIHNERENLGPLLQELQAVLRVSPESEVIAVDDGSSDGTAELLQELVHRYPFLRVLVLARPYGQTTAIAAGMEAARGEVLLPMDADGQNDPGDIPRFLAKIEEGYDIVSGWRRSRQDAWLRSLLSRMANSFIRRASGQEIHDYGCTMKAYRREVIGSLALHGDMHRFLAAYAALHGAQVAEIVVHHRPRRHGQSKYGFGRIWRVSVDLLFLAFFLRSFTRPMHFFGGIGLMAIVLGFLTISGALLWRFTGGPTLIETPLPVLATLFAIIGVQCILMGILGEMSLRNYLAAQPQRSYVIRAVFPSSP